MFILITCLQVVINCCHGNNKIFEIFIHRIIISNKVINVYSLVFREY